MNCIKQTYTMEKRINQKIDSFVIGVKKDLISYINTKDFDCKYEVINYIKSLNGLELTKQDFVKRKRVKNVVPYYDRCTAKKACGNQCTRRKLKDCMFCGTHNKSQPYGVIDKDDVDKSGVKKVSVWAQDIKGIIYYLDNENNVYDPSDVINNRKNPKIIAKYTKTEVTHSGSGSGTSSGQEYEYHIPSFGI